MGVDRNITFKGEIIASVGRAYKFQDLPDNNETFVELWRLIRLYENVDGKTDLEEFFDGVREWIDDTRMCGWRDCIDYLCEDEDMGWFDE
jgi:hypothetical protein